MDRGAGNGANAQPRRAARGIACSFETWRKIGEPDGLYQRRLSVACASLCVLKQRGGMRRSGALTLGAVLMLGGITGGRGDQLSGSVGLGGASSPGGFALPTLPENWADMPFQLTASQSVSYNSNILAAPIHRQRCFSEIL